MYYNLQFIRRHYKEMAHSLLVLLVVVARSVIYLSLSSLESLLDDSHFGINNQVNICFFIIWSTQLVRKTYSSSPNRLCW